MVLNLWLYVLTYVGIVSLGYLRHHDILHPIVVTPTIYIYWTAGSVLAYAMGQNIYGGVRIEYIGSAMTVFTVALICFAIPLLFLRPQRSRCHRVICSPVARRGQLVRTLNVLMTSLNLLAFAFVIPALNYGAPKYSLLPDFANASFFHYNYLLAFLILVPALFALFGPSIWRISLLTTTNLGFYLAYCILTQERDFVLFGLTYLVARRLAGQPIRARALAVGIVVVAMFFGISEYRSNFLGMGRTYLEVLAGQGSNLHIMTTVLSWIEGGLEYTNGMTYVHSVIRTVAPLAVDVGTPLAIWFHDEYAPSALGGWGFAIDAEAYMNWGMPGVIGVFLVLGSALAFIIERQRRGSVFWRYIYLHGYVIMLYAIRADSLMLIKAMTYGAISFMLILLVAGGGRIHRQWPARRGDIPELWEPPRRPVVTTPPRPRGYGADRSFPSERSLARPPAP